MSGFQTHMLIGGVGGLALATAIERLQPALVNDPAFAPLTALTAHIPAAERLLPLGAVGLILVVSSALLATWPDIDEPGSFISQRVKTFMSLAGVALGLLLAVVLRVNLSLAWAFPLVGGLLGALFGWLFVKGVRVAAGGHRRLTHSLVLSLPLAGAGYALWLFGFPAWGLIPLALAVGQWLHILGDVVTPSGWRPFWPATNLTLRILPEPICRVGEGIAFAVALLLAGALIYAHTGLALWQVVG